jgi:hypothetical protein
MDDPKSQPSPSAQKKKVPVDAAAQIAPVLKDWNIPKEHLLEISGAAQRSLEAVTHLTEYQDDKANRILTAMAFMSAFAAVVFAVVPSRYSLAMPLILLRAGLLWEACLLFVLYGAFIVYALTLTIGVAFILHAVRPRFNVPTAWKPDGSKPASYLFFEKITEVSPADWANAFANAKENEILAAQAKNSVLETYLIADKIGLKMQWLSRGVRLFFVSTIVLAVLLPLVAATLVLIPERQDLNRQELRPAPQGPVSRTPVGKMQ